MPSFGTVALPNINPLADFYASGNASNAITAGQLANQGTQQTLTDRATLRDLAPGLAANDPDAAATALTLPNVGGTSAAAGLAGMHADQRAQLGNTLAVTGALSGAILAAPPDQRAALWTQLRPSMVQAGAVQAPEQYPGDDFLAAHRTAALDAQQQIAAMGNTYTGDPTRSPLSAPTGPQVGPGGVVQGQPTSGSPGVGAEIAPGLSTRESGNDPGAVNAGGYSGMFQQGAARLSDPGVGVYTPAKGEDVNANTWQGQLNIPGFPDVKTHADFLANPMAQRAALAAEVANTDAGIAATPGADKLNVNGLRAVAHLGGVAGMQKFVATGGAYNPADSNGTRLSDYYTKFSQGGAAALHATFGHPDGTPLPDTLTAPTQYATRAPLPGDTATDASPAPAAPPVGTQGADAVLAGLRAQVPNQNALLPITAPAAGAPAPQNQLMPAASSAQPTAPAPQNQLMPPASSQPPVPAAFPGAPQLQPGETPLYIPGKGPAPASVPGYQLTRRADGSFGMMRMPGAPADLTFEHDRDGGLSVLSKATGAVIRQVPPRDVALLETGDSSTPEYAGAYSRTVALNTKTDTNGQQISADMRAYRPPTGTMPGASISPNGPGVQVGTPSVNSARQVDSQDYERDAKEIAGISDAGQAAQSDQIRIQSMRDALAKLQTGQSGATRAQYQALVQTWLPGEADSFAKSISGIPDAAVAQEFSKLALKGAGTQERGVLGARGGYQAIKLFQSANPSLDLLPNANQAILGMQLIGTQADADYSNAAQAFFNNSRNAFRSTNGSYDPLSKFDQQWQEQRNPQVYSAAMGALAGKPVADGTVDGKPAKGWASGLSEPEYKRALIVVSHADPTAVVNAKTGRLSMQPQNGAAPSGPAVPAVGSIMQGHRFLGGDPANQSSWQPVQ